ncbi:hypothetical protein CMQ_337 [Grosmannia clavigera kw1407]|uniref:Uncharacterized protein n=1 Tax=Grosmannia clavigera (strain kw1407 / UAMH 11150) TaxID=655863 RepID=F0XQP1_GROCL|nr:uncharacterized protein CMQ_337 [Grosmannia clavigera kw1407]EFX00020.1 hypothetical protein CMQ_337 [Grosmannia clavigera kw1407]
MVEVEHGTVVPDVVKVEQLMVVSTVAVTVTSISGVVVHGVMDEGGAVEVVSSMLDVGGTVVVVLV